MKQSNIPIKNKSCRLPGKEILMVVAVVTPIMLVKLTPVAIAGITDTAHDFSNNGWSGGEICQVCHTPHNSDPASGPLWNHETSSASYTLYISATMNSTPGQPDGISKLCLSCHDGTVALDSYGGASGSTTITGSALLGTDLSASHPISMTYDATLASTDGKLWDPTSKDSGLGGTIDAVLFYENKVECASCHDVHDKTGNPKLLVKDNSGSALCITCHKM